MGGYLPDTRCCSIILQINNNIKIHQKKRSPIVHVERCKCVASYEMHRDVKTTISVQNVGKPYNAWRFDWCFRYWDCQLFSRCSAHT